MPDRKPLEVMVQPTSMASDVVLLALAAHKRNETLRRASASPGGAPAAGAGGGLDYDRPEAYCLMMHDGDGLPDDVAVRNGH